MKLNVKPKADPIFTHEGARAFQHINAELQLHRSVMSCLLWEAEFYEDGVTIADRIKSVIPGVDPAKVAAIAVEARDKMKLRHVPLLIVREMARLDTHKRFVADTLAAVIRRPDELAEFCAIWQKDQNKPLSKSLSAQAKKGLARAFTKFNGYALSKYNRDGAVKLRDVLFLSHAKPKDGVKGYTRAARKAGADLPDGAGSELFKKLVDGTLESPDTWEVALSATKGEGKKEEWERLLNENKLGGLALLRNLRNFKNCGVGESMVFKALAEMKTEVILPFRFIAAARHAPQWEPQIEEPMLRCLGEQPKLAGKTALLIDVSGSMDYPLSTKSEMIRMDAAAALGILLREICDQVLVITFSNTSVQVPARRGFALRDAIVQSQAHQSTYGAAAVQQANREGYDRIIVLTDEQWAQTCPAPVAEKAYFVNVASAQNGIGYGKWTHVDGFSEAIIDYIRASEETSIRDSARDFNIDTTRIAH